MQEPTRGAKVARVIFAAVAIVGFLWAATNRSVYNHTSPNNLAERIFGEDADRLPHHAWLSLHVIVRKAYSIVAFAIVGFLADNALPPIRRRALRAALIVAAFSAVIEIGQKLHHAQEGFASNLFDVGCGALGGWIAVALRRLRRGRDAK